METIINWFWGCTPTQPSSSQEAVPSEQNDISEGWVRIKNPNEILSSLKEDKKERPSSMLKKKSIKIFLPKMVKSEERQKLQAFFKAEKQREKHLPTKYDRRNLVECRNSSRISYKHSINQPQTRKNRRDYN